MTIHSSLVFVAVAIMGVLVFTQILGAVRHLGLFGRGSSVVLALCVTLLGLIGLASHGRAGGRFLIEFDALLLPYVVLFIVLVVLALARCLGPRGTGERPRQPASWSVADADRTARKTAEFVIEHIEAATRGKADTGKSLVRWSGDLVRPEREDELPSPVTKRATGKRRDHGGIVR